MGDGSLFTKDSLPLCQVRFLLEQVDGAIACVDGEGVIQDCNGQLATLLGQHREDLLGRSLIHALPLAVNGQPVAAQQHPVQQAIEQLAQLPAMICHATAIQQTPPSVYRYELRSTATPRSVDLEIIWSGHLDQPIDSEAADGSQAARAVILLLIRPVQPLRPPMLRPPTTTAVADSREILSQANAAIAQFELDADLHLRCTYVSEGCSKVFGFSPAEMMAGQWCAGIFPLDQQIVWDVAQRRIVSSQAPRLSFQVEYRFQHRDGSVRWISNHLTAIRMVPQQPGTTRQTSPSMGDRWQVVCVAIDITHLKQIQEALYQSENRSRLAIDLAQVGSWEWDLATDTLYWNEHHLRLFNISATDPDPTVDTWRDFLHPEDLPRVETAIQTALSTHSDYEVDYRIIESDQTVRWIMEKGRAIYDEFGEPHQMGGIVMDITERKQAQCDIEVLNRQLEARVQQRTEELEAAQVHLRQREQEFRTLVEHSPDLIWRLDTQLRYVYINPMAQRQGLTTADLLGQSIEASGLPPEQLRHWKTVIQRVLATGQEQIWDFSWPTAEGELYYQTRLVPERNHADQIISVLAVARDVTALKQAENQLRQINDQLAKTNLELTQATRMKDEFLTNMSHELRTPLNSILGLSEALQDSSYGELTRSQQYYLSIIHNSGSHLLEIINDILDLTQITTGTLELDCSSTSITDLCEISLNAIKTQADRKHIALSCQQLTTGEVLLDHRRIEQVLVNLLSNAVKFTPDGGRVTLRVTAVAVPPDPTTVPPELPADSGEACVQSQHPFHPPMQQLVFHVEDTGIGIAASDIDRLFQPFVQLDSGLSRRYEGTGLGLVLVKQIVEMHGGHVTVSSQIGQGSCFQVTVPWRVPPHSATRGATLPHPSTDSHPTTAKPTAVPVSAAIASPAPSSPPLLLLIGETASHRETWSNYLRSNGFQVAVAETVADAVAMPDQMQTQPTLILLNFDCADAPTPQSAQSWLDQIDHLRAVPAWQQLPIIGLAGDGASIDQAAMLAAGVIAMISKPIRLKDLVTRLREIVS